MDALDRLFRRLADTVLDAPDAPLTIGDLYQSLIPYRLVRGELRFSELAEYEHALLRLLAGERDYLLVERPEAQEEFQRELRAPNPILGIYRDYAEVGVHLNPFAPQPRAEPRPEPRAEEAPLPFLADDEPTQPEVRVPPPTPAPAAPRKAEPVAEGEWVRPKPCPTCRKPLPIDRTVRYCPFCGTCLVPVPCPECSGMVEPEWRFCASCGWPRELARGADG